MRTKNAKRLWSVPATLAVMAVVALLAFGLMATTGAQSATAQSDDPDCTVPVTGDGAVMVTTDNAGVIEGCSTTATSATVAVPGESGTTTDDNTFAFVYAQGGTIAGGTTLKNVWDHDAAVDEKATTFSAIKVDIPPATESLGSGTPVRAMPTITVTPSSGKSKVELYVYYEANVPIGEVWNHDNDVATDMVKQIQNPNGGTDSGSLTITFLGSAALGEDLDTDFNRDLDDAIELQCQVEGDTDMDIVGEVALNGVCNSHEDKPVGDTWAAIPTNPDATESRSKLVVRTIEDDGVGEAKVLIDGTMVTHEILGEDDTFVIYAVVEDAAGEALVDTEVSFSATTIPAGIVAPKELSDAPDTKEVVSAAEGTLEDDQIRVTGLDPAVGGGTPTIPVGAIIEEGDSVVAFSLDSLPDGDNDSYRIEVVVTVGSLNLGTVVIARTGPAEKVVAGVFNIECFEDADDDGDYENAKFNAKAKGCDASGMADRFGAGEMFVVKAHHEDSLDLVVGNDVDLSSEFANEDDDLLGDADVVDIDDPVDPANGDPAQAWLYTIDDEATLGDHMITVSTTAKNADDEDIDDVTLTVTVAGPPTQYMFVDPVDNIELGDRAMFTVQAYDTNDGIPHLITDDGDDKNDTVEIVVPDIAESLVRGRMLDNGVLTLDADTGMGSFTIYAPSNAPDGSTARIFVSAGDVEITHTVTFGDPDATPDPMETDEFTADYTVDATSTAGSGMVDVKWTRSEELSLSLVSLIQGDDVVDFTITVGMSAQFSEVDPGEYDVSVFSLRNNADGKDGEIAFGTVTVE